MIQRDQQEHDFNDQSYVHGYGLSAPHGRTSMEKLVRSDTKSRIPVLLAKDW